MESIETANVEPRAISIARCRELLDEESYGMSDEEIDLIRQHAKRWRTSSSRSSWRVIRRSRRIMARRALSVPANGSKLPRMVGAVIYVRVSTKEQTENLSLPTQIRACEEHCRREGYEVLERFKSRRRARAPRRQTAPSCSTC